MKYLLFLILLFSCTPSRRNLSKELSIDHFKDRALCNCIVMGLDSNRNDLAIQKLRSYDPAATVLFDSIIFKNILPVLEQMYVDSVNKVGRMTEGAQGKNVFRRCIEYYKSTELDKLAHNQLKKWRKIKSLEEYISSKGFAW